MIYTNKPNAAKSYLRLGFISLKLIFCFTFLASIAQANTLKKENVDDQWTLVKDTLGVKISYNLNTCDEKPYLFIKIVNANNSKISIDWSIFLEGPKSPINLNSGETVSGSCDGPIYLKYYMPPGMEISSEGLPLSIKSITLFN